MQPMYLNRAHNLRIFLSYTSLTLTFILRPLILRNIPLLANLGMCFGTVDVNSNFLRTFATNTFM